MGSTTLSIQFNGQSIDVPSGTTIATLLRDAEIRRKLVAVEVNLEIIPRERHEEYVVCEGDVIEAVTLVGGG